MKWKIILSILVLISFIGVQDALAADFYLNYFHTAYPSAAGTRIDNCALCHIDLVDHLRNPYGTAFQLQPSRDPQAFINIQNFDSDGDGFTNIIEIQNLTFPGEATDFPSILTSIVVSPPTASLTVSGTQMFNATARNQNNIPISGVVITWASNDTAVGDVVPTIATTGLDGIASTTFNAAAAGYAMVTATNNSIMGSANVTVSPPSPSVTMSWEFISVPYQLNNSTVAYVLNGIQYDVLFGFDPINKIYFGSVTNFEPLKGYLIHMNTSQDITNLVRKTGQTQVPPSIDVKKGWNLIGTSGTDSKDAETMLEAIDSSYYSIWNFDVSTQSYDKIGINGMSGPESATHISTVNFTMQPKVSYWVWATQETSLPAYSP